MAAVYQDKAAGGQARSSASPAAFPARAAIFGRVHGSYAGSVAPIGARGPVSSAIFVRMMPEMYSNLATAARESHPGSGLRDLPPAQTAVAAAIQWRHPGTGACRLGGTLVALVANKPPRDHRHISHERMRSDSASTVRLIGQSVQEIGRDLLGVRPAPGSAMVYAANKAVPVLRGSGSTCEGGTGVCDARWPVHGGGGHPWQRRRRRIACDFGKLLRWPLTG